MTKSTLKTLTLGISLGLIFGTGAFYLATSSMQQSHSMEEQNKISNDAPLYWVAPMDANFKRDKPGKSPMGMDLVPVYADDSSQDSPGTVSIDPVTIQNLGVKTAFVKKVSPQSTINTYGEIVFAEDKIVHIHPRVEGWVEILGVRSKGDFIAQGDALYSLYAPELVNAQEEFLIALEQGNRALIKAAQARLMSLNAPQSLIDSIRKSRKIMRTITYYAPQSGYVSQLNIQEGYYVTPSKTMLAIASLEHLWVMADVFARDANRVTIGQKAVIYNEYLPQQHINATLDYIYPEVDKNKRTVTARLVLNNSDLSLKPGMYVDVAIDTFSIDDNSHDSILAIPKQAVIRTGESERIVLALGDGKYKSVNIKLGRVFDDVFEVLGGVYEGDEVVTSAQFLLDSESSISSDFMRLEAPIDVDRSEEGIDSNISAWTQATVNEVMIEQAMVNLTHGPLDEFNMMGMSMNFKVGKAIDIADFEVGQEVHVEIIKSDSGMYQVRTVHFMDDMKKMNNSADKSDIIDTFEATHIGDSQ